MVSLARSLKLPSGIWPCQGSEERTGLGRSPRNLQDRDSLESRVAAREQKTVWHGGKDKVRERECCLAVTEDPTQENTLPPEPGSDEGAGHGERTGSPGSQESPAGRGFRVLREPASALPHRCGSCH